MGVSTDATSDQVAAVLSGLAILGFLESLSAIKQQHQRPAAYAQTKHHTRRKPLKHAPNLKSLDHVERMKRSVGRPMSKINLQFPRHVFALPTLTPLPSQPGLFDGSEIVHRLLALQHVQPRPNYECLRTISCSTYLRRLFVCAEMSCLFPNPDERRSWQGTPPPLAPASPSRPPPLAGPFCAATAIAGDESAGLCAAALAPLSANALAAHSRVQDTVMERRFRQKRAPAAEDEDAAAAAAASSSSSAPTMRYEAVPVLDASGRAFCVLVEWERSLTSKRFVRWKGRLSKGWDAVCAANRILEGHTISLKLWLEEVGSGGGSGPGGGGQRKLSFIVVGRHGDDVGLLSGYGGGCGGGDVVGY